MDLINVCSRQRKEALVWQAQCLDLERFSDLKLKFIHDSVSRWLLPRVLKICDREVPQGERKKEDATEPDAVITGVGKLINPQGLRNMKWAPGISCSLSAFTKQFTIYGSVWVRKVILSYQLSKRPFN